MGGSSSSPLDIVAGVATGGLYTIGSAVNKKRLDAERQARTAVDQQKDAMIAQQEELKKRRKEEKKTAGNLAVRQRLVAQRGYATQSRGGTLFNSPTGASVGQPKTLLGE